MMKMKMLGVLSILLLLAATTAAAHHKTKGKHKTIARLDARVAVSGDDSKERIPTKNALYTADLSKGQITLPGPDAYPDLSDYQRERNRCRDSKGQMHELGSKYLTEGTECTYYECEYNPDINGGSWMLTRDIFKCCFEDKFAYKESAEMKGRCTTKVCVKDGKDNNFGGSYAWEFRKTGCMQCAIGLVMLEQNETFHIGSPCRHFVCGQGGELIPVRNESCCEVDGRLVADGELVMYNRPDCGVATCQNGKLTNRTKYQTNLTVEEYVSGCPVLWSHIQGVCYHSFTRRLTLLDAVTFCSRLNPPRNSRLMEVDFGGMIGTMNDVMELGRWYWLNLKVLNHTAEYMQHDNSTTPERFLVGHHHQPTVKKVNKFGKLAFEPAVSKQNAYVCQMDHRPSCKPTDYTEPTPPNYLRMPLEEL